MHWWAPRSSLSSRWQYRDNHCHAFSMPLWCILLRILVRVQLLLELLAPSRQEEGHDEIKRYTNERNGGDFELSEGQKENSAHRTAF